MNNSVTCADKKANNSFNPEQLAKSFDAILKKMLPDKSARLYDYNGQYVLCVEKRDYYLVNGLKSAHPTIKKITKNNLEGWNIGDKVIRDDGSLDAYGMASGSYTVGMAPHIAIGCMIYTTDQNGNWFYYVSGGGGGRMKREN